MRFLLFSLLLICLSSLYGQSDSVTLCRFYSYNDESVFVKNEDNSMNVQFFINHSVSDSMEAKAIRIISRKKGIHSYTINPLTKNELQINLHVSPLFDAHYLRIIIERNLAIQSVHLNDKSISWEEFEKMFLKISN